jgi:hypothetical protein
MAFFKNTKQLKDNDFKRLTGITRTTFNEMVDILTEADRILHLQRGRKSKLSIEDKLLMTLKYWREYNTIFSLAQTYEVAESTANHIIHWVEDTLSKSEKFTLPGKKSLQENSMEYEVFLVDATETPIERPKKKEVQK